MDRVGQFEVMGVKRAFINGPFFMQQTSELKRLDK